MFASHIKSLSTIILLTYLLCNAVIAQTTTQDIQGGASIVPARPPNPPVRKRTPPKKASTVQHTPSHPDPSTNASQSSTGLVQKQAENDMDDEVEDALSLANSARDDNPPRYADAERAYKLAIKLNSNDPRPYQGLGNIYFDQKRFEDAAKSYKAALLRMRKAASLKVVGGAIIGSILGGGGGGKGATIGAVIGAGRPDPRLVQMEGYTGSALLQQGLSAEAIPHLSLAMAYDLDAQWPALLGYAYFKQKKYYEASGSFNRAVKLAPDNLEYIKLQQSITFGTPNELKGKTKIYLDTGTDSINRQRIIKEIDKNKKKLRTLELLDTPEGAEVHLIFFCESMCEQKSKDSSAGYVLLSHDKNRVHVLMSLRDTALFGKEKWKSVSFIKGFIRAYIKAHT